MGEAKRRKQLGLMPTIHPYQALVSADGEITLSSGPADQHLREQLLAGLRAMLAHKMPWEREYRRAYVTAGLPDQLLHTAADVEAIPVPPHRRLVGELLLNYDPSALFAGNLRGLANYYALDPKGDGEAKGKAEGQRGTWLHHETECSFDGRQWLPLPQPEGSGAFLKYLMQHPVMQEEGELVAKFVAEHSIDGEMTFDPEPPQDWRPELEDLLQSWNGKTPEKWADIFNEVQDIDPDTPLDPPQRIRMTLEVRRPAPLPGLFNIAMSSVQGLDVFIDMDERYYTLDGETWFRYSDMGFGDENEEEAVATVYADGRLEWDESAFSEDQNAQIRTMLTEFTGAGDAAAWAERAPQLLIDLLDDELRIPAGESLPAPLALVIGLGPELWHRPPGWTPEDALELVSYTYDDEDWYDLLMDEPAPELQRFVNPDYDPLA